MYATSSATGSGAGADARGCCCWRCQAWICWTSSVAFSAKLTCEAHRGRLDQAWDRHASDAVLSLASVCVCGRVCAHTDINISTACLPAERCCAPDLEERLLRRRQAVHVELELDEAGPVHLADPR